MEVITSKRGGNKLCLEGHMYTKWYESKGTDQIKWRCVKRDPPFSCKAVLHTTKSYSEPIILKEHSHTSDESGVGVAKCRDDMKKKAATTSDKPNQIFTFANAEIPDDVKARMPSDDTIKRVLRRTRAYHRPRDPQSLHDLEFSGTYTQTSGDNPTQFLLYDNGPEADERIVIFATDEHTTKLAEAETWCMDGNFSMAPNLFMESATTFAEASPTSKVNSEQ